MSVIFKFLWKATSIKIHKCASEKGFFLRKSQGNYQVASACSWNYTVAEYDFAQDNWKMISLMKRWSATEWNALLLSCWKAMLMKKETIIYCPSLLQYHRLLCCLGKYERLSFRPQNSRRLFLDSVCLCFQELSSYGDALRRDMPRSSFW